MTGRKIKSLGHLEKGRSSGNVYDRGHGPFKRERERKCMCVYSRTVKDE